MRPTKIRAHYEPFKGHKIIEFVKQLRETNGVAYDAAMFMAISLDDNLDPLVPFSDRIPETRWGRKNALEFVRLLKDFYRETNSIEFFRQLKEDYQLASERFAPVYEKLDIAWYPAFYEQAPKRTVHHHKRTGKRKNIFLPWSTSSTILSSTTS